MPRTHVIESFRVVERVDEFSRPLKAMPRDVLLNGVVARVARVIDDAPPPGEISEEPRADFNVTIRSSDGVERVERVDGSSVIVDATLVPGLLTTSYRKGSTILELEQGAVPFWRWRVDGDGLTDFLDANRDPARRHNGARAERGEPKFIAEWIAWGVADPPRADTAVVLRPSEPNSVTEFQVRVREEGFELLKERRRKLFLNYQQDARENMGALKIEDTDLGYVVMRPHIAGGHFEPLRARAIYDPLRSYSMSVVRGDRERKSQAMAYAQVQTGEQASALALDVITQQPVWRASLLRVMNFSERKVPQRHRIWTPPPRR